MSESVPTQFLVREVREVEVDLHDFFTDEEVAELNEFGAHDAAEEVAFDLPYREWDQMDIEVEAL